MNTLLGRFVLLVIFALAGCGGGGGGGEPLPVAPSYTVSATAGAGGSIEPRSQTVNRGATATLTVTPDTGYRITMVSGCGGSLDGDVYTTGPITFACEVNAAFSLASGGYGEAPQRVVLVAATSFQADQVQLEWLETFDNDTPREDILYRLHAETSPNFIPSDATVRGEVVGGISGVLADLMPSTSYYVKVEARDLYGNRSWSNELSVITAAGVSLETADPRRVLDAGAVSNLTVMENEIRYELPMGQSAPEIGELLISPLGEGFLRRATSVTQQETEVVVGTEPAALNEVFEDLQLSIEIQLIDVPAEPEGMRMSTMAASPDHQTRLRSWPDSGLTLIQADPGASDKLMVMAQVVSAQSVIECDGISGRRTTQFDSPLRVGFPKEVCVEPGSGLSIDISAEIEPGFEAQYQITQLFLKEITHPKITKTEPLFGAEWVPNASSSDTQGKGSLLWTPQERHVDSQLRPYTARFVALAKEREGQCTGSLGWRCKTRKIEFETEIAVTWGDLPGRQSKPIFGSNADLSIDGSAAVSFQPTIRAGADIRGARLRSAEIVVAGPVEFENVIRVEATADASFYDRMRLQDKRFIKVFWAGGVPIVVNGRLVLDLEMRANVDAALDLTKALNIGYEVEAGVEYRDGVWHVLQKAEPWHRFQLSGEADTNAYAELRFIPDLEVSFYDVATGRLILEPFLYGQASLEGHFLYRVLADGSGVERGLDADYRFTDLQFGGGMDGRFRAGVELFDKSIVGFPERNRDAFYEFALIDRTPILGLPTLMPTQSGARNPLDCRAVGLAATVEPVPNPFRPWLGGPATFNSFVNESASWEVVLPNGTEVIYPGTELWDAWFNAGVSGQYTVRFSGHSSLGSFIRQYESVVVDFDATADDCGFRLTPVAGEACEAHGMCGITFSFGEGADLANTNISVHWGDGTSWGPQSLAECVAQGYCADLGDGNYRIWKAYGEPGSYSVVLEFRLGDSSSYGLGPVVLEPAAVDLFPLTAAASDSQATLTWTQLGADSHNLCQAGEAIVDINQCGVYQGGAWSLNVGGPPLTVQGLENDQTHHFRLEAIFGKSVLVSAAVQATPRATSFSATHPINDTGIDWCADGSNNFLACPVTGYLGQDGEFGRDAANRAGMLQKVGAGATGFDYTKIANNGSELPESATLGSGPNDWACTRDNVTGLIWEVKTADGGLRDRNNTYTWYQLDGPNMGNSGTQNGGSCVGSACDTTGFVQAVNAQGLCGATGWRLPTVGELHSIVHHGRTSPAIDTSFFPNTPSSFFWSASPYAGNSGYAWSVSFITGYDGNGDWLHKRHLRRVRLVRGGQ